MHTGHYISGAGHLALIVWLLVGDIFAAEPLPIEMTPVSVVTGAEYAAMMAAGKSPQSTTEVAQPSSPEVTPDAPEVASTLDTPAQTAQPTPTESSPADPAPEVAELTPPPQADVSDSAPELPQPSADVAVLVPEVSDRPVPRASDRVAPEAVAEPDPEATPDPVEQEAVQPDTPGEETVDQQEAQAPEAATTEIVPEAEKPTAAPEQSMRPPARRPEAPVRTVETPPETPATPEAPATPETSDTSDAVNDALAEALSQPSSAPSQPQGPPLTAGEKDALRVAVQDCWVVDVGGRSANVTVTVAVSLDPAGKVSGSLRMLSSEGGDDAAVKTAFAAARRAILRCQKGGYKLPADKYDQWQDIEMTFNPERMRIK